MSSEVTEFDFEKFEKMEDRQEYRAQNYLNEHFPKGASVSEVVKLLTSAGAVCQFVNQKEHYYFCKYERPGHGVMALVSTIEWMVTIKTDSDGKFVQSIGVGRGATGP